MITVVIVQQRAYEHDQAWLLIPNLVPSNMTQDEYNGLKMELFEALVAAAGIALQITVEHNAVKISAADKKQYLTRDFLAKTLSNKQFKNRVQFVEREAAAEPLAQIAGIGLVPNNDNGCCLIM